MYVTDLDSMIKQNGKLTFNMNGTDITFDLRYRHERHYAAKTLLNIQYPLSDLDDMLFKLLIKQGDVVLDGGANIGFTALSMLNAGASKVIAVEPVPEIYERLKSLNNESIIKYNYAISSEIGKTKITISLSHNQGSTINSEMLNLSSQIFGDTHKTTMVNVTTIDNICALADSYPNIWKLDIEGAEVDALDGATFVLEKHPPRAIIAELYGPFLKPFLNKIKNTHPYAYKALVDIKTYKLYLAPVDLLVSDIYHKTSPMFVFSQEKLD